MKFDSPAPTAPQWLAFLGSFMVPKGYMEKVGVDAFREKPVGTGPYKLVEYQLNSRIVLERNDGYWGPKPKLKRITFDIVKDPSARVAAIQSGQVDLTINVPVREVERLKREPNLAAEINPITRVILLQVRNDLGFADQNVRLAAHHAIDKAALSKAFYGGAATPLSVVATPGTPRLSHRLQVRIQPRQGEGGAREVRLQPEKPAQIKFAATNGHFPSDYDIARAIEQMWKKVGIEAELEDHRIRQVFRAQPRRQAARGDALQLGQRDRRSGDFRRLSAQSENAVLGLEGHGRRREGARAVQRRRLQEAHRRAIARSTRPRSRPAPRSRCCKACSRWCARRT